VVWPWPPEKGSRVREKYVSRSRKWLMVWFFVRPACELRLEGVGHSSAVRAGGGCDFSMGPGSVQQGIGAFFRA
jgi:hypothetical protein